MRLIDDGGADMGGSALSRVLSERFRTTPHFTGPCETFPGPRATMQNIKALIESAGLWMEAAGVAVIALGATLSSVNYLFRLRRLGATATYAAYRVGLARSILLGLELLVAGDIIRTVVVAPTLENVGLLAAIVLIRTFLSFTLELEVTGRVPWRRRENAEDGQSREV